MDASLSPLGPFTTWRVLTNNDAKSRHSNASEMTETLDQVPEGTTTATCITKTLGNRSRRANQAKAGKGMKVHPSRTKLLALPEELLEKVLILSGSGAPALAVSCQYFNKLWHRNIKNQAQYLLDNSSSIMATRSSTPKLAKLLMVAEALPNVRTRDLLWVSWALSAVLEGKQYGGCDGQHLDGSCCRFELNKSAVARQKELVQAAGKGNIMTALSLINGALPVNVRANGNEALRAAASGGHMAMIVLLLKHGADMRLGLVEGGGALLESCRAGNVRAVECLLQHRTQHAVKSLGSKELAERTAICASNLPLFVLLHPTTATIRQGTVAGANSLATIDFIVTHQRNPLPFIHICVAAGASPAYAVSRLLSAGKWATADSFARSLPLGAPSQECWSAICEGYMSKTGLGDRWDDPAVLSHVWEAGIEAARRSCQDTPACLEQWKRIYTFSFSVNGGDTVLDMAEEAAQNFAGDIELRIVADEHQLAGRFADEKRCKRKARVIERAKEAAAAALANPNQLVPNQVAPNEVVEVLEDD